MPCSLNVPNSTRPRKFAGPTGSAVSLSVRGTNGSASFTGGFYGTGSIPVTPSATFTILAGDNALDLVIESTLTDDRTQIVCDADGTVLFEFAYDRNNPAQLFDVTGI